MHITLEKEKLRGFVDTTNWNEIGIQLDDFLKSSFPILKDRILNKVQTEDTDSQPSDDNIITSICLIVERKKCGRLIGISFETVNIFIFYCRMNGPRG
mgnify:FL=1